ncbi:uncharacterized protein LOC143296970 isoform X2 [Babylonia areolata]|uniref:uncharacterized protein LOC143296970 isoform X2 n=1 Tax=Babylonia areolata TaxID=304850 RepID=UPI003FD1F70B
MAQRVPEAEKRLVYSLKEEDGSTMPKRLKQGRLPFQPLGGKPLTPLNNTASRKRKLSGNDSPNTKAKQPKLPDLKTSGEKVKPSVNDDNEVSSTSSSEAEHSTVNSTKSKTGKANLLEKFVRREDEISSTNEVIDLTESVDENDPKENSPVKVRSPRKSAPKSPKIILEKLKFKAEPTNFSRKLVFDKEDAVKNGGDKSGEGTPHDKDESAVENVSMECVASSDKEEIDKTAEGKESISTVVVESESESPNSSECETSVSPSLTPEKAEGCGSLSDSKTPANKAHLSSTSTPQTPASLNTSRNSADGATPLTSDKKKRSTGKKQQEKSALRQRVKDEKEKQKQEAKEQKEKERLEKKQKRDEEKAEKERAKKEEKEKKEKERLEKKEQLEKEKQVKLQQKEEEKQKKLEKINAKLEEKRLKEEEKKQKEELKQKEEEEKLRQAEKRKAAFTSFFMKPKAITSTKVTKAEDNLFIPFELKKDMTLAPVMRKKLSEEDRQHLESIVSCQKAVETTYLSELHQGDRKPPRTNRVLRKKKEIEQEVELLVHDSETVKKVTHAVKLLQFHTDNRPPYYGTWRKKVKGLSPRNPWKKDEKVFDYEVDSDEEWEEEEPGESLSDSNGEEEEGEEEDEGDDDGWMVPHGYLSEDEGCQDDEDVTPEVLKARQRAKAQAWEAELKAKKQVLPPLHLGCHWLDRPCVNDEHLKIFRDFEMVFLRSSPIETLISCPTLGDTGDKYGDAPSSKSSPTSKGCRKRALPEEAMPDLIRLLHGNHFGIKKLVREFRLYWKQKSSDANLSLDESRIDNEDKALNDSIMDMSANLNDSVLKAEEPVAEGVETTEQEPMQTESQEKMEEDGSGKKHDSSSVSEEASDSCVSKRQLEMKILAIAVREKREGKKPCWYVSDSVLKQYSMEDLSLDNAWVYVSGDMVKKAEKKTLTPSAEKNTKARDVGKPADVASDVDSCTTPHKGKEAGSTDSTTPKVWKSKKENSAKKTPKDQPSIMAFAKKAAGAEKAKPSEKKGDSNKPSEKIGNSNDKTTENGSKVYEKTVSVDNKNTEATTDQTEKPADAQSVQEMEDDDCIILD